MQLLILQMPLLLKLHYCIIQKHHQSVKIDSSEDYKATCNYCGNLIKFKGGPTIMKNHLWRYPDNPNKGQKVQRSNASSSQIVEGQVEGGVRSLPSLM